MANFPLPIKGYSVGTTADRQPELTTGYMNNIRIRGILGKKLVISTRPGLDKVFDEQIGGSSVPIVFVGIITTVD
jgi:hypothetical protein